MFSEDLHEDFEPVCLPTSLLDNGDAIYAI